MGRVFIDGFESGDLGFWITSSTIHSTTGLDMDGDYCMSCNQVYSLIPVFNLAELWITLWIRVTNAGYVSNTPIIRFIGVDLVTTLGRLDLNYTNCKLELYKGEQATLLGATTTVLNLNQTYKLEIRYKPHLTSGNFELKIDGAAAELSYLGVSTSPSTQNVGVLNGSKTSNAALYYFDNLIIDDADYPGILSKIVAILPNANGDLNEWTPSAGDNYACVDERPPASADYVTINAVDKTELYDHAAVPGEVYVTKAVQMQARAVKEGAATPSNLKLAIKPGDTVRLSADKAASIYTSVLYNLWTTNPDTGLAFTTEELNTMQIGFESAA